MVKATRIGWTVDELIARAALALADAPGQASGRVRDVPDLRAVRYYASLGLLDRPASFRGRTALYEKRHLAQMVAIKRLQARGLSLAEVQQRLAGCDEHQLLQLAELPHAATAAELLTPPAPAATEEHAPARRADFWRAPAAEIPPAEPSFQPGPELASVPLDPRALLVLDAARNLDEADLEAIRAAAAPLVKLLQKRGLLGPHNPEKP